MLKENNRYEILTPDGFKNFLGIQKLQKNTITFICDGASCEVSDSHIFHIDGLDVISNTLSVGDHLNHHTLGRIKILSIINNNNIVDVYDPINVDGDIYYADDILHHNCSFLGSDSTIIEETTLRQLLAQPKVDPIQYLGKNNALRIYKSPEPGAQYIIGVDTGKGTGEHYSTIQVFKVLSISPMHMEQVAVFEDNHTDVYEFSGIVNRVAITYNMAYVVCENNAEGNTVVTQLWWEYEYENLVSEGTKSTMLGVRATTKTKPAANLMMKKFVEDGSIDIVDYRTIQQFLTFLDLGGNKFGGNGQPDDLISAFYWACYFFSFDILDETFSFKKEAMAKEEGEEDIWGIFGNDFSEDGVEPGYELVKRH